MAKKRKQSREHHANPKKEERSKKSKLNPFLKPSITGTSRHKDEFDEGLLAHTVAFLDLGKKKEDDSLKQTRSEPFRYLLDFFERHSSPGQELSEQQVASVARTAAVLLPWTIGKLLGSPSTSDQPDVFLWRTLATILKALAVSLDETKDVHQQLKQTVLQQALTDKTLLKIIPLASEAALQSETDRSATECYEKLLQSANFVPSLDIIFKSLLPAIANAISDTNHSKSHSPTIISTTLQSLKEALKLANPKRAFQVLSTAEALLPCSQIYCYLEDSYDTEESRACQEQVLEILCGNLFHPHNHLDGFRSLVQLRGIPIFGTQSSETPNEASEHGSKDGPTRSRFQCYQENLLNSLDALLTVSSPPTTTFMRPSPAECTVLMARLLPLLLQGYLERLPEIEAKIRKISYKKSGSKFDLAQMQFFFFGTIVTLLWQRRSHYRRENQKTASTYCLQSVRQCLKLLLKHDAFVPSDDQKEVARNRFLESLTIGVLEMTCTGPEESKHATSILETLVRLDHRLVHERIERVITFVTAQGGQYNGDDEYLSEVAPRFLATLLETYHQLRQSHHCFTSILATVSSFQNDESELKMAVLLSMMSHPRTKRSFAVALNDSPTETTTKMFESLDRWIVDAASSTLDSEGVAKSFELVVQHIGVGLFGNVRVDKSTARDVAQHCETYMKNSVQALCNNDDRLQDISEKTKLGVTLCGWVINLQMRCSFWLGKHYILKSELNSSIPQRVRGLLDQASQDAILGADKTKSLPNDLVRFASFRLRKLDYLIHELSLIESEELSMRHEYEEEAKRLAGLMVNWVDDGVAEASKWHHIAQVVTSWVPYASERNLQKFLMWIFSALADVNIPTEGALLVFPGSKKMQPFAYKRNKAVAQSLVNDASFFEIPELSEYMALFALKTIALLIREAIDKASTSSCGKELGPKYDHDWNPSSPEQFAKLFKYDTHKKLRADDIPDLTISLLRGAYRVAKILTGMSTHESSTVSATCADLAARLQASCMNFQSKDPTVIASVLDLISALRLACANSLRLSRRTRDSLYLLPRKKGMIKALIENIKHSSTVILKLIDGTGEGHVKKYLFATEELVKTIAASYLDDSSIALFCCAIYDFSKTFFSTKTKPKDLEVFALCNCATAVLSALCSVKSIPHQQTALKDTLLIYLDWLTYIASLSSFGNADRLVRQQVDLLAGSSFRLAILVFPNGISAELAQKMGNLVRIFVPRRESVDERRSDLEALLFMVTSYATTNPPVNQRVSLVGNLISLEYESELLNASICSLTCRLEGDALRGTLFSISQRIREGWILGLQLFSVLIQRLTSEGQIETISSFSQEMLQHSLDAFEFLEASDDPGKSIAIASSVIIGLTQNREIMTLRERHIVLILAQTSKIIGHANQSNSVYTSCFGLVAALMQRFPKQMCTCAPSLIAVLHAFQRHVLSDDLDDIAARERCQKFTRLCELLLPHKEVYKKHVLCLLLEFVQCLGQDLSVVRKDCLLSSVFYLLDMLSKYEMEQLNTLMDTTAKTLFRSVHQKYNKLHAYKGQ